VIAPDVAGIEQALAETHETLILKLTPRHLEALAVSAREIMAAVRTVVVGGEQLLADSVRRWHARAPQTMIVNEYGPTETTVGSSFFEVTRADPEARIVPIGAPIAGTSLYLLDAYGRLAPTGCEGELHIGGAGVAIGYLAQPRATAEAFVPDPFGGKGGRLYRTGDLARRDADGTLTYLGRIDRQMKLRGYRVEPGEVEAALLEIPGVSEAVVVQSGQSFIAYLVASNLETALLKRDLELRLPEYMVPSRYVLVPRLPLGPNGKLDQLGLEQLAQAAMPGDAAGLPRTVMEKAVSESWCAVIGASWIDIDTPFFEAGGDSLMLIEVAARLCEATGQIVPATALFEHPTIRSLAELLSAGAGTVATERGKQRAAQRADLARGRRRRPR